MPPIPTTVVGIDGYRRGWVAVRVDGSTWSWATAPTEQIGALIPIDAVVGIDMPIGLLDRGERLCDRLARGELRGASPRVFTTPPRQVLELGPGAPNDRAQELSRRLMGKGVSRQSLALGPRILALDTALSGRAGHKVIEVHPELSFAEMGGGGPMASKKSAAGVGQRMTALLAVFAGIADVLASTPPDVPIDDALDALAALWTATRWRDGTARTLPPTIDAPPFIAV